MLNREIRQEAMKRLENLILQCCKTLDISRSELAARAGISRETLYRMLRGEVGRASVDTVFGLARATQTAPIQLLRLLYHDLDMGPGTTLTTLHAKDHHSFVRDVTVPDNMLVEANQRFTKIWEVQNTGEIAWNGRSYRCMDDEMVLARRAQDGTLVPVVDANLLPEQREVCCPAGGADYGVGEYDSRPYRWRQNHERQTRHPGEHSRRG